MVFQVTVLLVFFTSEFPSNFSNHTPSQKACNSTPHDSYESQLISATSHLNSAFLHARWWRGSGGGVWLLSLDVFCRRWCQGCLGGRRSCCCGQCWILWYPSHFLKSRQHYLFVWDVWVLHYQCQNPFKKGLSSNTLKLYNASQYLSSLQNPQSSPHSTQESP